MRNMAEHGEPNTAPPSLPIPELEVTLEEYLQRLRPLLEEKAYHKTGEVVARFAQGKGKQLHQKLQTWRDSSPGSWLKPFWDNSYLSYREELNGNMNYALMLDRESLPARPPLPELCAVITRAVTGMYLEIVGGGLAPETVKGAPLCMEQYANLLKACRIPQFNRDKLFIGEKTPENNHIAVLCRQNIYLLQVTDGNGRPYTITQLAERLAEILERKDTGELNVGILTTARRDDAARLREELFELDPVNRGNFHQVENALFALCIDEPARDRDSSRAFHDILFSDGRNRYFDKSSQVIVGTDYHIGFNNEHTGFDGSTWMAVIARVWQALKQPWEEETQAAEVPAVKRLEWVAGDAQYKAVRAMEEHNASRAEKLLVKVQDFNSFGKAAVKEAKMSPDAFFHLAVQLAWYRLNGKLSSTYEAVSVRGFHQGRTECARPGTSQMLAFVRAVSEEEPREVQVARARAAAVAHGAMLKRCQAAQGPERHLLGLQVMLEMAAGQVVLSPEEDLFGDEGYRILKRDILSTSGLSADHVKAFGYGPVVADGFGLGYGVLNSRLRICLSCWQDRAEQLQPFLEGIQQAFHDLYELIR